MPELQTLNRGNQADYVLGTVEGWDAFDVVRFHASEALSEPFEYDVVLARGSERGPVDIEALVDTGATFCIATEARWRPVHGIVGEAELLEATSSLLLYRAILVPHLCRAGHRRRCRTFVDKSLEEIVETVLENRAPDGSRAPRGLAKLSREPTPPAETPSFASFSEPAAFYRWSLLDPQRAREKRRMVVQYNESDLDFVARLLEAEGISYFFEHGGDGAIVTLSDRPGHAPLFARDERHDLVGLAHLGQARDQEVVRAWRPSRRLRSRAVTMRDYAWRKSLTRLEATARAAEHDDGLEHFEFPAADEDEPREPGAAPARFQMERFQAEQSLGRGTSTVRTHAPGFRFRLSDRAGVRDDEELLVVRLETFAAQLLPEASVLDDEAFGFRGTPPDHAFFETRFEALPADVRFRPARTTAKPRISGVQTARVTAEELGAPPPELNSDEFSRVRVRFPWDQRPEDGTPTSKLIRVCQYWAGAGFGALFVPRVGHEVLVAFERGDPDRPIIVGRLYNEQNPPPYAEANTTKSTLKSDSVGEDGSSADGFNELRFDDAAGKEQIFLHAQRNLDEVVLASHSTTVGGSQSNTVGGDQSNTVHGSRTHHVHGTELVKVDAPRTTEFGATESHSVASHRVTGIGGNDTLAVVGDHSVNVNANQRIDVGATRSIKVGASQSVEVGASEIYQVGADRSVQVSGNYAESAGTQYVNSSPKHVFDSGDFTVKAGSATLHMEAGLITLDNGAGASVILAGGLIVINSGNFMDTTSGMRNIGSGGAHNITAGGNLNATATLIKLNG